jgi:hypothetical protein
MKTNILAIILILLCFAVAPLQVLANQIQNVGTNVETGATPLPAEGKQWQYTNYPVKTELDKKYDIDSSGFLEPNESRRALKDKYEMVQTTGETGVDMDLLREYDANGNGAIDAREAQEIRDDLELSTN